MSSQSKMKLLQRCLDAASQCVRNPSVVTKADFPTRAEFDAAIAKLADRTWRIDYEPYHKAYARALDSPEGRQLYFARERAPVPEPTRSVIKRVQLSKAEMNIEEAVRKYQAAHPGVGYARALCYVLDANPELYGNYLDEGYNGV